MHWFTSRWDKLRDLGARFIADLSYSLYLVHPVLLKAVELLASAHPRAGQLVLVPLTLAAALLLRHSVELTFIRLRDRIPREPDSSAARHGIAVGILISGRGSNLRSIAAAVHDGRLDATVGVVMAD